MGSNRKRNQEVNPIAEDVEGKKKRQKQERETYSNFFKRFEGPKDKHKFLKVRRLKRSQISPHKVYQLKQNATLRNGEMKRDAIRIQTDLNDNALVAVFDRTNLKRWVLGIIYSFIPRYELYVVEDIDDDNRVFYVVPRCLIRTLFPFDFRSFPISRSVFAVFPGTTVFYQADILSFIRNSKVKINFRSDEPDGKASRRTIYIHEMFEIDPDVALLRTCEIEGLTKKLEDQCVEIAKSLRTAGLSKPIQEDNTFSMSMLSKEQRGNSMFKHRYGFAEFEENKNRFTRTFEEGSYVLLKENDSDIHYTVAVTKDLYSGPKMQCTFLRNGKIRSVMEEDMVKYPQNVCYKLQKNVFARHYSDKSWTFRPGTIIGQEDECNWIIKFQCHKRSSKKKVHSAFVVEI